VSTTQYEAALESCSTVHAHTLLLSLSQGSFKSSTMLARTCSNASRLRTTSFLPLVSSSTSLQAACTATSALEMAFHRSVT